MKFRPTMALVLFCVVLLSGCAATTHYPPPPPGPGPEGPLRPRDLRVRDLDMAPDPVRQGMRVRFRVTLVNRAEYGGRVNLSVRDMDEMVAQSSDVFLRPGENVIEFPHTGYRFSRDQHCFTVAIDVERTWSPIDLDRTFCARKLPTGWTLAGGPGVPVPPGPPPQASYPVVYAQANFQGPAMAVEGDFPGNREWAGHPHEIRSIRVPEGWRVVIYDKPKFRGKSNTLDSDWTPRPGDHWYGRIRSIRVYRGSPPIPAR